MNMQEIEKQMEIAEQRLVNIDLMVGALAERVARQAISLEVVCPRCSHRIQVTVGGNARLNSKTE